jgi:hypothetical protein
MRRRAPGGVRLAAVGLFVIGGVLITLSLMAAGVFLSDMQIDPHHQGGTGYFDFVLFFNGVLCLLPFDALVIVLGVRLLKGDRWAWIGTLALCGVQVTVVPLAVFLLPAPAMFAIGPAALAVLFAAALTTPGSRRFLGGRPGNAAPSGPPGARPPRSAGSPSARS